MHLVYPVACHSCVYKPILLVQPPQIKHNFVSLQQKVDALT